VKEDLNQDWSTVQGVVWDWGDTLMRDIPGQVGPMVNRDQVEAMPGALSAVQSLSGLPVRCVATNAMESDGIQVAAALDRVGLRPFLAQFFTSGELQFSKPDPEFFAEVARRLGVPPMAILAVGNDYKKDIVPAKAVGMRTVFVSGEEDPGSQDAADVRIPSLTHIPRLVREWGLG
jgi:HAD superfamily hydrolase (TIGR01509 family)